MDPFSGSEKMEKTVSLKWSSHVPFSFSSLLGGLGTLLAEDSLTSAVFARLAGGSAGAQTGVSSNRVALS